MFFEHFLTEHQNRVEKNLKDLFSSMRTENSIITEKTHLIDAMEYACLNGGKRLRPLLVYATGSGLKVPLEVLDVVALAVELIHCYSLIHDDLPAMDDDDLRRGKPTCHKAYDEAIAILAGDALQTLAFQVLSDASQKIAAPILLKMIRTLSEASGYAGMGGGQALDLMNHHDSLEDLSHLHLLKTGALIQASVKLAAYAALQNDSVVTALEQFAYYFGLGFQIQDDILDVIGSPEKTGKNKGSDERLHKTTYTTLLDMKAAKNYAAQCYQLSLDELNKTGVHFHLLTAMVEWMHTRTDET